MQVGTTKDQGVYNKPSAAVHPGAVAAGTLPQYSQHLSYKTDQPWVSFTNLHCIKVTPFLNFAFFSPSG